MPSPDVIVKRRSDGWAVELNRSTLPAMVINEDYAAMVTSKKMDDEAQNYSANALNNARWLKASG
jgi:RNA polymerase sigma-54 factor